MAGLVAATALAGSAVLLGGSAAHADGVTVTPTDAIIYTLTQFSVSGTGADFGLDQVNVLFNGVLVGAADIVDENGGYTGTVEVPPPGQPGAAVCGSNTVTITEPSVINPHISESGGGSDLSKSGSDGSDTTLATGTLFAECATIDVNPDPVGSQQFPATFQVTPFSFPASSGFRLTVDGAPQHVTMTPAGGLDFTGSPACGEHQVVLAQPFRGQTISASAPLTVLCSRITLTPPTVPQPGEPATVTVGGQQFHSDMPIAVSIDGHAVGSAVSDEGGNFTVPVTVRGLTCAVHHVAASEQPVVEGPAVLFTATAPLAVTRCPVPPVHPVPPAGQPTLTLAADPVVLTPGMLTHVTGGGFVANQQVTLSWQLTGGPLLLGSMMVKARGDGRIDTYFMVLLHDLFGGRQLVASQGGRSVTADVVVDNGTMQPSTGNQLVFRR